MSAKILEGAITFINHEKEYAMIEYLDGGKKKIAKGKIDIPTQKIWQQNKKIKKTHQYSVGDVLQFNLETGAKTGRLAAVNLQFKFNNALNSLLQKATIENKFLGYLKKVDDDYFVKEIDSYLFFPVKISPWQLPPDEKDFNEPVSFSMLQPEKKDNLYVSLTDNKYLPEFNEAVKLFKSKTVVEAEVYRVTSHSLYVHVVGKIISAKINAEVIDTAMFKIGDKIPVKISYLSKEKIAVVPVDESPEG